MIALDLISDAIPPVKTSDTIQKVLDRMTEILSIPEPESVIDAADDVNTQTPIQNRYCSACSHLDGLS